MRWRKIGRRVCCGLNRQCISEGHRIELQTMVLFVGMTSMKTMRLILSFFAIAVLAGAALTQTKVIIARHGTSEYDPSNPKLIKGVPDPPLSARGREEALRLAQLAREEGVDFVFHSPLLRARQTAEIVGRGLGIKPIVIDALTEFNLGDLLGKDWSQSPFREQLAEVFRHPDNKRPGGESFNELSARLVKALTDLSARHSNRRIMLISHGITNRALWGSYRNLSAAAAFALPVLAGDEAIVVVRKGNAYEWKVVKIGAPFAPASRRFF